MTKVRDGLATIPRLFQFRHFPISCYNLRRLRMNKILMTKIRGGGRARTYAPFLV